MRQPSLGKHERMEQDRARAEGRGKRKR